MSIDYDSDMSILSNTTRSSDGVGRIALPSGRILAINLSEISNMSGAMGWCATVRSYYNEEMEFGQHDTDTYGGSVSSPARADEPAVPVVDPDHSDSGDVHSRQEGLGSAEDVVRQGLAKASEAHDRARNEYELAVEHLRDANDEYTKWLTMAKALGIPDERT